MNKIIKYSKMSFVLISIIIIYLIISYETNNIINRVELKNIKIDNQTISDSLKKQINKIISNPIMKKMDTFFEEKFIEDYFLAQQKEKDVFQILKIAKRIFNASHVFVMDIEGNVILSTQDRKYNSLKGNNYKYSPFFYKALQGKRFVYPALDIKTKERGIYFSIPINYKKSIVSVFTVKIGLEEIDQIFNSYDFPIMLLVSNKIVFTTNTQDLTYSSINDLDKNTIDNINKTRQFANLPIIKSKIDFISDDSVKFKNQYYAPEFVKLSVDNWNLLILHNKFIPKNYFDKQDIIYILIILFLIILLYFAFNKLLYRFFDPFKQVLSVIKNISEGNYRNKIDIKGAGELKKLSESINHLSKTLYEKEKELKELNITIKKEQYEKLILEKQNEAKKVLLADISHETRTPLSPIISYSKILLSQEMNEINKKRLSIINSSGKKLLSFMNDILEFSKYENNKAIVYEENLDLTLLVEEVIEMILLEYGYKSDINFKYNLKNIPELIKSDSKKIYSIIKNILENAFKYTEKGNILLDVEYINNRIIFKIEDSGIGIPKEKLKTIFNHFEQLNTKSQGAGIGLALINKIIVLLNGTIDVESIEKKGTIFTISIPIVIISNKNNSKNIYLEKWLTNIKKYPKMKKILFEFCIDLKDKLNDFKNKLSTDKEKIYQINHELKGACGNLKMWDLYDYFEKNEIILKNDNNNFDEIFDNYKKIEEIVLNLPFEYIKEEFDKIKYIKKVKNSNISVLIVEDNLVNQDIISFYLNQIGLYCDFALNGKEALEKINKNSYKFVLMDIHMPVLNGIETIKILRKSNNSIPVIALTAVAIENEREKLLKIGFNEYLTKPINEKILFNTIERFIKV